LDFVYINNKPPLDVVTNAINLFANQSEEIVQNITLPEFTVVINDTVMHDSVLINGLPYDATTTPSPTTTSFSTTPIYLTTLSDFISKNSSSTTSHYQSSSSLQPSSNSISPWNYSHEYVGCFYTDNGLNVFTDSITMSQCRMAETKGLPLICYIGGESTHFLDSHLMTIELCLEMCITTYGYRYAGLAEYI
jgi:hypothetical protein